MQSYKELENKVNTVYTPRLAELENMLVSDVDALQRQNQDLKEELDQARILEKQHEALQAEVTAQRMTTLVELQRKDQALENLQQELAQSQSNVTRLEQELAQNQSAASQSVSTLEAQVDRLQQELAQNQSAASQNVSNLEAKVDRLQQQLAQNQSAASQSVSKLEAQVDRLQQELAQNQSTASQNASTLEAQVDRLQQELAQNQSYVTRLQQDLAKRDETILAVNAEIDRIGDINTAMYKDYTDAINTRNATISAALKPLEDEIERLRNEQKQAISTLQRVLPL